MKFVYTVFLATVWLIAAAQAQSYTESVFYAFGSTSISDGATPNGLIIDSAGNLYGTTFEGGGSMNCFSGCGIVYKLTPGGAEKVLHIFRSGTDGAYPWASLTRDKSGNLYGTTYGGGYGYGTVFKITAAGKYSVLHRFGKTATDGYYPSGPLVIDGAGNLYGTTYEGGSTSVYCTTEGSDGCGTIFKLTPSGTETILYRFTGSGTDGGWPEGNIIRDGLGNIYGTNISSVFFKLSPSRVLTPLYQFPGLMLLGGSNIARSSKGKFYGNFSGGSSDGIWEVTPAGLETTFTLCTDCWYGSANGSTFRGPIMFSGGKLYGTAYYGGGYYSASTTGGGVVYQFDPETGIETLLYSFPNPDSTYYDGWYPNSGVIADADGNLYGTTVAGSYYGQGEKGIVFKLTKN